MTEATEATEATAAAVFATHTQLRFDMMDSDETKLSPHKQKFVLRGIPLKAA